MNSVILSPIEHDDLDKFVGADGVAFTWRQNGRVTNYLKLSHQEIQAQSLVMSAEHGTTRTCKPCFERYGVFLAVGDCVCGKRPSWELWEEFGFPAKMDWHWAGTST